MTTALKVAARWQRQAGMFDPPPAMMKVVAQWISQAYAGHMLVGAQAKLKAAANNIPLYEELIPLPDQNQLVDLFDARQPIRINERRVQLDLRPVGANEWEVRGKALSEDDAWDYAWELIKKARQDLSAQFLQPQWDSGKVRLRRQRPIEERLRFEKQTLVSMTVLIRHLKSLGAKPSKKAKRAQMTFPMDLSGWKYMASVEDEGAFWDNLRKKGLDKLRVHLAFDPRDIGGGAWDGYWDEDRSVLAVRVPSTALGQDSIKNSLVEMIATLRHEMEHVGQTVLKVGKGLKEEGGLPGKDIRDPAVAPSGRRLKQRRDYIPHELRDVEFYTNLQTKVDLFKRMNRPDDPDVVEEAKSYARSTYDDIAQTDPRRAGKAITEFVKAIEDWASV